MGDARRAHVAGADLAGEAAADRAGHRGERDLPGERRERPEQGGVGQRPAELLARDLGRRHRQRRGWGRGGRRGRPRPELLQRARGVDQQVAAVVEPGEQVDLVQQGRVLDDERVGVGDRLVQPDGPVVEPAERRPPGAPVRSEPNVGKACACRPSAKAATDSSSAAVTAPWPPRPWMRTENMSPPPLDRRAAGPARRRVVGPDRAGPSAGPRSVQRAERVVHHERRPEDALDDRPQVPPEAVGLLPEVHPGPEDPEPVDRTAARPRLRCCVAMAPACAGGAPWRTRRRSRVRRTADALRGAPRPSVRRDLGPLACPTLRPVQWLKLAATGVRGRRQEPL